MSSFKKVLAVSAGAALGLSTLAAMPATAAANNLELSPTDGANYSVFNADTFELDVTYPTLIASDIVNKNLAFIIDNPDSANFELTVASGSFIYDVIMIDENGDAVTGGLTEQTGSATLDFASDDAVRAIIHSGATNENFDVTKISLSRVSADAAHGVDGVSINVTAWIDTNGDFTDVETIAASETRTVSFVDPAKVSVITKLERLVSNVGNRFNLHGESHLVGTVRFSNPNINLDQTTIGNWAWEVFEGTTSRGTSAPIIDEFFDGMGEHDDSGRIVAKFPVSGNLVGGSSYQVKSNYDGKTREFTSAGFQVVKSSVAAGDVSATYEIKETANIADDGSNGITLRPGTESATFTLDIGAEEANVPVVVFATSDNNGEISLTGASGTAEEGESVLYTTLTNSNGEVSVTVNSLTAANGDVYTLGAEVILNNGTSEAVAAQTVTYENAAVDSWSLNTNVLSGESLTLTAKVVDQFGEGISLDGTKEISVGVTATDDDNLELFAPLVDGVATFNFNNYLAEGETDVLTVNAFTGATDDQSTVSGLADEAVTLYAQYDVSAINVTSDKVDATVVYVDFADDLDAAPATESKATINGTVIDGSGSGVPGSQVTLTAGTSGILFENADGDFEVDSMTVSTTESGTFEVDVWTHVADEVDVTITSGGQTATVTIDGALPDGENTIKASELVLSWNLPEVVVVNTTYAVTATLTDVWGNPIPGATVNFNGEAAAQFNSEAKVPKVTNRNGQATAYLRSLVDVTGLAAVSIDVENNIDVNGNEDDEITTIGTPFTDNPTTSWDESAFTGVIEEEINFLATAPAATTNQKVNAGSFKGYVAVYALGYEGQRLSAKIGNNWVIVDPIVNNQSATLARIVQFIGLPGIDIQVRIYIDRVLVDTIPLTTIM